MATTTLEYNNCIYKLIDDNNLYRLTNDYYKNSPFIAVLISTKSLIVNIPEYIKYNNKKYYVRGISHDVFSNIKLSNNDQPIINIDKNNRLLYCKDNCIYESSVDSNEIIEYCTLGWCFNRTLKHIKIIQSCDNICDDAFGFNGNEIIEEITLLSDIKNFIYTFEYLCLENISKYDLPNLKQINTQKHILSKDKNNNWKIL